MSFYRSLVAAVAAMTLATAVFATDEANNPAPQNPAAAPMQTADASSTTTTETTTMANQVNVNTATAKDLMKVKGMTAAKAKAIVSYRKKHGDFKSLDDLKEVKGFKKMSEEKMKQLQDQLTVG